MSNQEPPPRAWYPPDWETGIEDFSPLAHVNNIAREGDLPRWYMMAQWRLYWFERTQKRAIADALSRSEPTPHYSIETTLVQLDLDYQGGTDPKKRGFALCVTTIVDVWGNRATDLGSCTAANWKDFIEKAATKSKSRAIAKLGYGTQFALEEEDDDEIADTPLEDNRHSRAATFTSPKVRPTLRQLASAAGYVTEDEWKKAVQGYLKDSGAKNLSPQQGEAFGAWCQKHPNRQAAGVS